MKITHRLTILNFLEFAVWGAYLTSMGGYLAKVGLGANIGWFYSVQGFVSLLMPALMGIVSDRWIQAQKTLSICHLLAGGFMIAACAYGLSCGDGAVDFGILFTLYTLSVAFFMPTIALTNSVAYNALEKAGLDTVKAFPPIRVWGTVGFIISMWIVDLTGWQVQPYQFGWSGVLSLILAAYALTMPACPTSAGNSKSLVDALGLRAFTLFKNYRMALFFIFSMLLGCCLQITNGYASPFIQSFGADPQYVGTFGVEHANILISISQMSETLCILLIPFFLGKFGIKRVMLISMLAWVFRFGFFAVGNPGSGVWLFILSMIVYGVAFDFFNISGSLFVDKETNDDIRNSAQGLFMMMTNGFGASIGMIVAGYVIDMYTTNKDGLQLGIPGTGGWTQAWFVFAAYALVVAILFAILFRYKHVPEEKK